MSRWNDRGSNDPYRIKWIPTHRSVLDGSPAMLVASKVSAGIPMLTLRNEDGYVWTNEAFMWEVI